MVKHFACLMTGILLFGGTASAADIAPAAASVPDFTLADFRGKDWSLHEVPQDKLVVLAVVGTECPLAQKYLVRLQQLSEKFAEEGVVFFGINANRQDSLAEIAAQVRDTGLTFPMLKDTRQAVVASLDATRTPEVFVLDRQRIVRYRGRIDDQHSVGNRSKTKPDRDDLRIALEELLAGKDVSVPKTDAVGCLITRGVSPDSEAKVTYSNQISRLLQKHCVECHRPGEIAPFSLTDYEDVAGWADMMVEVTQTGQMPPWHAAPEHGQFRNARGMTAEEKQLLVDWAAAGAPLGDPSELPPPREFLEGWQLPREPDLVVAMRDEPYQVPAEGVVEYQYFMVDPHLTEDKWVTAAEIVPGNRAVVHHVLLFAVPPGAEADGERGQMTAYVPGIRISGYPEGYAKRISAGSKLVFQVHYTPIGTPEEDMSKVGFNFTEESKVTHSVITEHVKNTRLSIQPNEDDQQFESRPLTSPLNVQLLDLMPHMHLRGKSFRFELGYPDGRREILLDVPHYDFNWQTVYLPKDPIEIPKGATIYAEASYDNSTNNLANPDPNQTVHWGDQTWDEMLIGYFNVAVPKGSDAETVLLQSRVANRQREGAERLMKLFDKNQNGTIEKDEINERQRQVFERIDTDEDGIITTEEVAAGLKELRDLIKRR